MQEFEVMQSLAKKNENTRMKLDFYVKGLLDGIYIANIYAEKKLFCSKYALDHPKFYRMIQDEIDKHYYIYSKNKTPMTHIAIRTLQSKYPCK